MAVRRELRTRQRQVTQLNAGLRLYPCGIQ
nr:MAG TPA_asm: hypothetical protein [Caudoviricetes sp.]